MFVNKTIVRFEAMNQLGDKRQVKSFAYIPRIVSNKWVWFKPYLAQQEWVTKMYMDEKVVSIGLFTEKYIEVPTLYETWHTIERIDFNTKIN